MSNNLEYKIKSYESLTSGDFVRLCWDSELKIKKITGSGTIHDTQTFDGNATIKPQDITYLNSQCISVIAYLDNNNYPKIATLSVANDKISILDSEIAKIGFADVSDPCTLVRCKVINNQVFCVFKPTSGTYQNHIRYTVFDVNTSGVISVYSNGSVEAGTTNPTFISLSDIIQTYDGYSGLAIVYSDGSGLYYREIKSDFSISASVSTTLFGGASNCFNCIYDNIQDVTWVAFDDEITAINRFTKTWWSSSTTYSADAVGNVCFQINYKDNLVGIVYTAGSQGRIRAIKYYDGAYDISLSDVFVFENAVVDNIYSIYDYLNNLSVISYRKATKGYVDIAKFEIDFDNSIYYYSSIKNVEFLASDLTNILVDLNESSRCCVVAYKDVSDSLGKCKSIKSDDRLETFGVCEQTLSSGSNVPILVYHNGNVYNGFSGLTADTAYYLSITGTLTTTVTDFYIGWAVSTTAIQFGYYTS